MVAAAASSSMTGAARFLAAARGEPVDRTPVWFMRQAGRSLAGYRALRHQHDILAITRTPELCAQVTVMPVDELGVDAAVLYADIMLPLYGMGVPFSIDPGVGPIIHAPVRTAADIAALRIVDAEDATPELFQAIDLVRRQLEERTAVLGFAGAPFTVASYLIEGRPSKDFARAKGLMFSDPGLWHQLMETLTEVTIRYLLAQVRAGVQAVQLFDSWVGALSRADYEAHALPYSRRILSSVRETGVPTIHFGTSAAHILDLIASAGSDVVSVDWRLPLDQAWSRIGATSIQGNLDPAAVLAPWPAVEQQVLRVLAEAGDHDGHIFNLGHGVLADSDANTLRCIVDLVHERTQRD